MHIPSMCDNKMLTMTFLYIHSLLFKSDPSASPRLSWALWGRGHPSLGQQCRDGSQPAALSFLVAVTVAVLSPPYLGITSPS